MDFANSSRGYYPVGYNNIDLVKGSQYKGPQFVAIGNTGKMSDVKVSGYGDSLDEEVISISKLNKFGVNYKDVSWLDIPDEEMYGWYWYDADQDEMIDSNDDELIAGEGLKIQAEEKGAGWQFVSSGEVALDGVVVTLAKGSQYLASAAPRTATFGEVIVSGYGDSLDEEIISMSKLNKFGVNYKDVSWLDIPDEEMYGWYWYDADEDEMIDSNNDTLEPGDALKVQVEEKGAGWTITFPPAIPADK